MQAGLRADEAQVQGPVQPRLEQKGTGEQL